MGYHAKWVQTRVRARARRPKTPRLGRGQPLRPVVAELLARRWSPEQIAGHLRATAGSDRLARVSAETIYRAIYVRSRGGLRDEVGRQVALRSAC